MVFLLFSLFPGIQHKPDSFFAIIRFLISCKKYRCMGISKILMGNRLVWAQPRISYNEGNTAAKLFFTLNNQILNQIREEYQRNQ